MIRCNNCGADIEETQTQCPYCHAMQYEASEKEYMNHLYKMNDTMDGLDENANRYIRNRIICHAVITLAAVAAALLVGTAWGYTKYRSYYNSASERREIAEGMAWYDENVPQINEAYEQGNFADISEVTADSYKNKILQQWKHYNILYIYKIEAKIGTIRMVSHVGMVHPMYCSGVGKAIMAELPESEVKQIWNESIIEKKTEHTITDYDEMLRVLKEAKKNGYALDDEENEEGVRCIAASLRDYHNEVKYAFSISGPTSRMTRERVEELSVDVKKVQEELSMELGWYRK